MLNCNFLCETSRGRTVRVDQIRAVTMRAPSSMPPRNETAGIAIMVPSNVVVVNANIASGEGTTAVISKAATASDIQSLGDIKRA